MGGFVCFLNVLIQINAKEINSRTALAKHAKTFTPSEKRWEKISFFFFLNSVHQFPKAQPAEDSYFKKCVSVLRNQITF